MIKMIVRTLILLSGLAAGIYWYQARPASPAQTAVRLSKVSRGDLIQRVSINGYLVPKRKTVLTPSFAGYVKKIFVKVGDEVKAGDPIVAVTQSVTASQDDAFPMRAPFNGRVTQILKTEGEYVESQPTSGMVRIDDLSNLFVQSNAPEVEFPKLKVGLDVLLRASSLPEKSYKGRITSLFQAAKEQDRWEKSRVEFPLTIEVLDEDAALKPGMTMIIDVITDQAKDALLVRHEFIRRDAARYFVVSEGGTDKEVHVGLQNEEFFEIKDGVSEGESLKQIDFAALTKDP